MTTVDTQRVQAYLDQIREGIAGLERLLSSRHDEHPDPYVRRRQLLERIYLGGGMVQEELWPVLKEAGTTPRWIGQQKKIGYLVIIPLPNGRRRYAVTPKAVRELGLGEAGSASEDRAFSGLSDEAFAEDWDNPQDAAYDRL